MDQNSSTELSSGISTVTMQASDAIGCMGSICVSSIIYSLPTALFAWLLGVDGERLAYLLTATTLAFSYLTTKILARRQ